jgi:hypothetical protein
MPADWTVIENAIFDWVHLGSGLAADLVVWAAQTDDSNRPPGQHVQIQIGPDVALGGAPHVRHKYLAGQALGQEIALTLDVVREIAVSVQVFGGKTTEPTTGASARGLAGKIQKAISLPTRRQALNDAGLAPFDVGTIEHVPEVLDADFEARAVFTVRMLVADDAEERVGYIATVEITDLGTGAVYTVDSE